MCFEIDKGITALPRQRVAYKVVRVANIGPRKNRLYSASKDYIETRAWTAGAVRRRKPQEASTYLQYVLPPSLKAHSGIYVYLSRRDALLSKRYREELSRRNSQFVVLRVEVDPADFLHAGRDSVDLLGRERCYVGVATYEKVRVSDQQQGFEWSNSGRGVVLAKHKKDK